MELLAKAADTAAEISEKLRRGAEGIEIQLLGPDDAFFGKGWPGQVGMGNAAKVMAVHTPLSARSELGHCPIETPEGFRVFRETCRAAEDLAQAVGHRIHVVCHFAALKPVLEGLGMYGSLVLGMKTVAMTSPDIDICIENTPYDWLNWDCDNLELAEDIGMPNTGICIDTCHGLIGERIWQAVRDIRPLSERGLTLEGLFSSGRSLCRHIHLCGAADTGSGYGRETGHGTSFTGPDDADLARLLRLIRKYTPDAMKVLEVSEDDYYDCVNYSKARSNVLAAAAGM